MSNQNINIPQPVLEEHLLIEQCAPELTLTQGLKSRVMAECIGEVRKAKRGRRLRRFAMASVAACMVLGICLITPNESSTASEGTALVEESAASPATRASSGTVRAGVFHGIAVDSAKPTRKPGSGADDAIEGLNRRSNIMRADMIPGL